MKTKLFSGGLVSEEFSEHLDTIANVDFSGKRLDVLSKNISRWLLASESKTETEAIETLREEWSLSPIEMKAVFGIGSFFLQEMDEKDTISDIMADLKTVSAVDPKKLSKLEPFINSLLVEIKTDFPSERIAISTQKSGLKILKGITHLVDLRTVVSNLIKSGEDVKKYKPIVKSLVPVIILRLRLSDDDIFIFQMDRNTAEKLKDTLEAAQKELDETIEFVGKDKIRLSEYNNKNE
jgi:hypothetical protein